MLAHEAIREGYGQHIWGEDDRVRYTMESILTVDLDSIPLEDSKIIDALQHMFGVYINRDSRTWLFDIGEELEDAEVDLATSEGLGRMVGGFEASLNRGQYLLCVIRPRATASVVQVTTDYVNEVWRLMIQNHSFDAALATAGVGHSKSGRVDADVMYSVSPSIAALVAAIQDSNDPAVPPLLRDDVYNDGRPNSTTYSEQLAHFVWDAVGNTVGNERVSKRGKIAKRLVNAIRKTFKVELGGDEIGRFGAALGGAMGVYTLITCNNLMAGMVEEGDFGDRGSCFFASRVHDRQAIALHPDGGMALLYDNGGKPVGRCWLYKIGPASIGEIVEGAFEGEIPNRSALHFWNGYSHNGKSGFHEIVKLLFDEGTYQETSTHSDMGIYTNGDGYTLGSKKLFRLYSGAPRLPFDAHALRNLQKMGIEYRWPPLAEVADGTYQLPTIGEREVIPSAKKKGTPRREIREGETAVLDARLLTTAELDDLVVRAIRADPENLVPIQYTYPSIHYDEDEDDDDGFDDEYDPWDG